MTNRERMAMHATERSCAGCHNLVDPIGFGFEKFDAIGQRRDKLKIDLRPEFRREPSAARARKSPLSNSTSTPRARWRGFRTPRFASPKELGAVLAASPQCQECVVKQYFRYVAGRTETPADRPLIRSVFEDFRQVRISSSRK